MARKVAWVSFVLWTLGMAYLLLTPGSGIPKYQLFEGQDKVAHLVLFTGWCFLFVLVLRTKRFSPALLVFFVGVVIAGITEWLQAYIPYRTPDLADFGLDLVGIAAGVFFGFFAKKELFSA